MTGPVRLTIDGVEIEARAGQTILQAADEAGIYIPRLCNHPDLAPFGSCRVCTVLVDGRPQSACTAPVGAGMIVENESERVLAVRRDVIDMLFVEGNHFCMYCEKSGSCELQALAYRFGITAPALPYQFPERPVDGTHPDVFIDHNRCILCARCVRASTEIDAKGALGFLGRGWRKRLAPSARGGLVGTNVEASDRAVDVCPVGSIMPKRVGFAVPIGMRAYDARPIGSDLETGRQDDQA